MSEIDEILKKRRIDEKRLSFVLEYIQNARRSGRGQDIGRDSDRNQKELIAAANSLYDKAHEACMIPEEKSNER